MIDDSFNNYRLGGENCLAANVKETQDNIGGVCKNKESIFQRFIDASLFQNHPRLSINEESKDMMRLSGCDDHEYSCQ
jgi:hypothetical protein